MPLWSVCLPFTSSSSWINDSARLVGSFDLTKRTFMRTIKMANLNICVRCKGNWHGRRGLACLRLLSWNRGDFVAPIYMYSNIRRRSTTLAMKVRDLEKTLEKQPFASRIELKCFINRVLHKYICDTRPQVYEMTTNGPKWNLKYLILKAFESKNLW